MAGMKLIAKNKRASYDYALTDKYEAGLVLRGTEVKSLREGKCMMSESFCSVDSNNEIWIFNMNIPHYSLGTYANHEETRKRKLLLSRSEILNIKKNVALQGLSIIPTKIYFKKSLVKMEISLGKGKKLYDKRQATAKRDVERKLRQGSY